jgi:hypothetical protein
MICASRVTKVVVVSSSGSGTCCPTMTEHHQDFNAFVISLSQAYQSMQSILYHRIAILTSLPVFSTDLELESI